MSICAVSVESSTGGSWDGFLYKLDKNGSHVWSQRFGGGSPARQARGPAHRGLTYTSVGSAGDDGVSARV
ncbi:MAG: hypothetical protein HY744_02380 [Deltaproteobacteria bacterium]|nr:hypothetical protein [Deltaproteobacteria bacterium]